MVKNDLSILEYDSFENCVLPDTKFIIESWVEKKHKTMHGKIHDIVELKIFNISGEEILPNIGDWKVVGLSESSFSRTSKRLDKPTTFSLGIERNQSQEYWGSGRLVKIADKNGLVKSTYLFEVVDFVDYLKKLSKFSYWNEFELSTLNDDLAKENESLKAENQNLQEEIDRLNEGLNKDKQ